MIKSLAEEYDVQKSFMPGAGCAHPPVSRAFIGKVYDLDAKVPMILERNFKPGGPIRINHKDIKNVVNTAHSIDVPIPYTAQLYEILQSLKIHGHMEDDHGGIVQYFEKLAGTEVKKNG